MRKLPILAFLAALLPAAQAQEIIETDTHNLRLVADGVWFAVGNGSLYTMSNTLVIERDEDVVIVDSHVTPAAGAALRESIAVVTDKPVTTVINSHFHYDHAFGTQAFGDDVQVIGHEYTRARLAVEPLDDPTYLRSLDRFDNTLAEVEARLASADDDERAGLEIEASFWRAHVESQGETDPVAPDVAVSERLTLYRGGREIQLHWFGRAHTGGDLAVYLPGEKIVFTGDMMLGRPSYMGDGYVGEWAATLANLKQLDIELVLPGHGDGFSDLRIIDYVQAYYEVLKQYIGKQNLHLDGPRFRSNLQDSIGRNPQFAQLLDRIDTARGFETAYVIYKYPFLDGINTWDELIGLAKAAKIYPENVERLKRLRGSYSLKAYLNSVTGDDVILSRIQEGLAKYR